MTAPDPSVAKKIARLMRASRKDAGLTQQAVSNRLSISQGALSKMEHAMLIPSAPQWFEFVQLVNIPAESLMSGLVDRPGAERAPSPGDELRFKIPKQYLENAGSKVRATLPFLAHLRKTMGDEKAEEFIASLKIDPDYFVDLDHRISLNFILDVARALLDRGALDYAALTAAVKDPASHGLLQKEYSAANAPADLLLKLFRNAEKYETNFKYVVEEERGAEIVVSIAPREHLHAIRYKDDPKLGDFLCQYKKHYFQTFSTWDGKPGASLVEKQCHYHGADRCVYQFRMNG